MPLLLLLLLAACGSVQVVARTAAGEPLLVRSGQPTGATLERLHRQYGIRTVVNLRGENPEERWWQDEAEGVRGIGAHWVQLRMGGREPPDPLLLAAFFDLIEDPGRRPLLLHCESGIHRTGALVAYYRMQYEGWSAGEAIEELHRNGFRLGGRDRGALEEAIRDYEPDPRRRLP